MTTLLSGTTQVVIDWTRQRQRRRHRLPGLPRRPARRHGRHDALPRLRPRPGSTHTYQVRAIDAAGLRSPRRRPAAARRSSHWARTRRRRSAESCTTGRQGAPERRRHPHAASGAGQDRNDERGWRLDGRQALRRQLRRVGETRRIPDGDVQHERGGTRDAARGDDAAVTETKVARAAAPGLRLRERCSAARGPRAAPRAAPRRRACPSPRASRGVALADVRRQHDVLELEQLRRSPRGSCS